MNCILNITSLLKDLGYNKNQILLVSNSINSLVLNKRKKTKVTIQEVLKNGAPILTSYPDQLQKKGINSVILLNKFLSSYFKDIPVYPLPCWESNGDGGFSIVDFKKPRKTVGKVGDLRTFIDGKHVCFDMILSNISSKSLIVRQHLMKKYNSKDSMVAEWVGEDTSTVPKSHRGHDNIRRFDTKFGSRWLWTTFSPDQVNLNYSSPNTLIWMLSVIAWYIDLGVASIRLDAMPFTWSGENGPQLHAPECHTLAKIIRTFIDYYQPGTLLIIQSDYGSKPLHDYIGTQDKEAHLLYRHELAPLIIHCILSRQKKHLEQWIQSLVKEKDMKWISFLSTCDGIFLRPWDYPLPQKGIKLLVDACNAGGGITQHYHWETKPPATLCTTTYSILSYKSTENTTVKRLILAYAMLLALPGIPALFFNSIFGMKNWEEWSDYNDEPRSIVRQLYNYDDFVKTLNNSKSLQCRAYQNIKKLIDIRISHKAFGQDTSIKVNYKSPPQVLSWFISDNNRLVACYFNIGKSPAAINLKKNSQTIAGKEIKNGRLILPALAYSWIELL